jgi:hypothetical protein
MVGVLGRVNFANQTIDAFMNTPIQPERYSLIPTQRRKGAETQGLATQMMGQGAMIKYGFRGRQKSSVSPLHLRAFAPLR